MKRMYKKFDDDISVRFLVVMKNVFYFIYKGI